MDITEAQHGWLTGCFLLIALVVGWSALSTATAMLREERVRAGFIGLKVVRDRPGGLSVVARSIKSQVKRDFQPGCSPETNSITSVT